MRYNNIVLLTLQAGCLSRRSETKTDGRAARLGDQILTRLRKTTPRQGCIARRKMFYRLAAGSIRRFLDSAEEEVGGQVRQVGQVGLSPAAVGRWRTPGARLG